MNQKADEAKTNVNKELTKGPNRVQL